MLRKAALNWKSGPAGRKVVSTNSFGMKQMRKILSLTLTLFVAGACFPIAAGCKSNASSARSGSSFQSSGQADFDQSAQFAVHTVGLLKARGLKSPSEILEYMFSVQGSAELTPPSPELEPDAASMYRGPRPSDKVWIQSAEKDRNEFFEEHLLLSADDAQGLIVAEAYKAKADEPFYRWEWKL